MVQTGRPPFGRGDHFPSAAFLPAGFQTAAGSVCFGAALAEGLRGRAGRRQTMSAKLFCMRRKARKESVMASSVDRADTVR